MFFWLPVYSDTDSKLQLCVLFFDVLKPYCFSNKYCKIPDKIFLCNINISYARELHSLLFYNVDKAIIKGINPVLLIYYLLYQILKFRNT